MKLLKLFGTLFWVFFGLKGKMLVEYASPLTTHINTVLHLMDSLLELLENLNQLEGVEGFMQFDDEEEQPMASGNPRSETRPMSFTEVEIEGNDMFAVQ